ncbi:MAG: PEGA domain-containing protein [Bryobacteraceae bacterium]
MGPGNLTPLEELKSLDQQIDQIHSLAGLQPLFARLEEITKQHSDDFEVQLVAHDVKQHMLARGSKIKQTQPAPLAAPPPEPEVIAAAPPIPAPDKPRRRKGLVWAFVGLLALAGIAIAVSVIQDRNQKLAATTPMDANITTVPPGAAIAINGQQTCTSDCVAKLAPGTYQVAATLDGHESANAQLTIAPSQAATLKLTLTPQNPNVRIFADLQKGQVFLDDQPGVDLQDGQLTLEHVEPGTHTVRVAGGTSEASFSFATAPAALPAVAGMLKTKDLLAVLVSNVGTKGRLVTSSGPLKLVLNGQAEADATTEGIELTALHTGASEFVLGEGTTQRTLTGTFDGTPTLTAYLKTDQKIGTLLITTGQDDVRIFIDNKEQKRRTVKGQARIQTFGDVTVRVEKPGFEPVPVQKVKVEQGSEIKLAFAMKALPQFASISVSGAAAGTQILLSDRLLGTVGGDGSFRNANIAPGEHSIELRRDQFEPKRFTRTFRAGETVVIGVAESTLAAIPPPPPPVAAPPPPKPEPAPVKAAPPKVRSGDISNFDVPGAWQLADGVYHHKGAANLTYGLPPSGIFTFSIYMLKGGSVLRGGRVRWFLNYTDAKNYILFEMDEENLWSKVIVNGKSADRKRVAHKQDKSMRVWNIQLDVSAAKLTTKIQGDDDKWVELDSWTEPGRDFTKGKFGIQVTGGDEVGLSNFTFTGR